MRAMIVTFGGLNDFVKGIKGVGKSVIWSIIFTTWIPENQKEAQARLAGDHIFIDGEFEQKVRI